MSHEIYNAKKAPAAIGPYSHGAKCGGFIFTSGQIPLDPKTGEIEKDVKKATQLVLNNVLAIIEEGGGKKENIIKMEMFVADLKDFGTINEIYAEFFGEVKPVRWLVQAAQLPAGAVLEAAATAYVE